MNLNLNLNILYMQNYSMWAQKLGRVPQEPRICSLVLQCISVIHFGVNNLQPHSYMDISEYGYWYSWDSTTLNNPRSLNPTQQFCFRLGPNQRQPWKLRWFAGVFVGKPLLFRDIWSMSRGYHRSPLVSWIQMRTMRKMMSYDAVCHVFLQQLKWKKHI